MFNIWVMLGLLLRFLFPVFISCWTIRRRSAFPSHLCWPSSPHPWAHSRAGTGSVMMGSWLANERPVSGAGSQWERSAGGHVAVCAGRQVTGPWQPAQSALDQLTCAIPTLTRAENIGANTQLSVTLCNSEEWGHMRGYSRVDVAGGSDRLWPWVLRPCLLLWEPIKSLYWGNILMSCRNSGQHNRDLMVSLGRPQAHCLQSSWLKQLKNTRHIALYRGMNCKYQLFWTLIDGCQVVSIFCVKTIIWINLMKYLDCWGNSWDKAWESETSETNIYWNMSQSWVI